MIRDLGIVRPGTTLYLPFHTFDSNDPSASVTMTGLATTDIEIYKDGSTTQRASDSGYALLDTDGTDFDAITGIHGISIDLADNTTSGFYAAGSQYWVVISSVTVDAATINFVLATFRIGYQDALINTTIATLASQTSFTLTSGPAENSALVGCPVVIHDVASAVQIGHGIISAYTGATKTVTLAAGTTFTAAAGDNISVFMPANTRWAGSVAWGSGAITAGSIASSAITSAKFGSGAITSTVMASNAIGASQIASNAITAAKIATDAITADKIAANAIGASELATDAVNEIVDQVWDEAQADHVAAGSFGLIASEIATIDTVVDGIQTDLDNATDGLGAIKTDTAAILADTGTDGVVIAAAQTVATVTDVTNQVTANVTAISGDTTAADNLEASLETMLVGTATGGTTSTVTSALTGYGDDTFIGRVMLMRTGTLQYEGGAITDYDSATGTFTFAASTWTQAPTTETFVIV